MERLKLRLYITSLKDELGKAMYDYIDQNIPDLVRFYIIQLVEATPEVIKELKNRGIEALPALTCDEWQAPVTGISAIKSYFDQVKQVHVPGEQPVIDTEQFYQSFIDEEYQASKQKGHDEKEPDIMERYHMEVERRKLASDPAKAGEAAKQQHESAHQPPSTPQSSIPAPPMNVRMDNVSAEDDINNYLQHEIKSGNW